MHGLLNIDKMREMVLSLYPEGIMSINKLTSMKKRSTNKLLLFDNKKSLSELKVRINDYLELKNNIFENIQYQNNDLLSGFVGLFY